MKTVYAVLDSAKHWDWVLHTGVPSSSQIKEYVQGPYTACSGDFDFKLLVNRYGAWAFRGQGPSGSLIKIRDGVAYGMLCGPVVAVRYDDDGNIVSLTTDDIAKLHSMVDEGYCYNLPPLTT